MTRQWVVPVIHRFRVSESLYVILVALSIPPVTFWQRQIGDLKSTTPCNYYTLATSSCPVMTWWTMDMPTWTGITVSECSTHFLEILDQRCLTRSEELWVTAPIPRYLWLLNLHNPQKRRSGDNSRTFFLRGIIFNRGHSGRRSIWAH